MTVLNKELYPLLECCFGNLRTLKKSEKMSVKPIDQTDLETKFSQDHFWQPPA
jgi:hypothetical protein